MAHCRACASLVEGQMRLIEHEPSGSHIDLWQCVSCGTTRSCRPGWKTRCPVCLDSRTVLDEDIVTDMRAHLRRRGARADLAGVFEILPRDVGPDHVLMVESIFFLVEHQDRYARPGWTVKASDVRGMPWGYRDPQMSHGTWAIHEVCGTVQKVTQVRTECRVCPPDFGSRTHRAKAGQAQYLYVVRWIDLLKFGHGDANRVRTHLRAGCEAIQVLRAPHESVVRAEVDIKRALRADLIDPRDWNMPPSFGAGSEVVADRTSVELKAYLAGRDVLDVTHQFRRRPR